LNNFGFDDEERLERTDERTKILFVINLNNQTGAGIG